MRVPIAMYTVNGFAKKLGMIIGWKKNTRNTVKRSFPRQNCKNPKNGRNISANPLLRETTSLCFARICITPDKGFAIAFAKRKGERVAKKLKQNACSTHIASLVFSWEKSVLIYTFKSYTYTMLDLILNQFCTHAQKNFPSGNAHAPTGFLCLCRFFIGKKSPKKYCIQAWLNLTGSFLQLGTEEEGVTGNILKGKENFKNYRRIRCTRKCCIQSCIWCCIWSCIWSCTRSSS